MSNQKDVKILSWTSNQMDVRLVVGPDHYHPTHLHVKDTAELLRLLAIDWKILYADESHKTDLGQRIGDAIYGQRSVPTVDFYCGLVKASEYGSEDFSVYIF